MAEPEYRRLTKTRVRRKGAFAITATRTSLWLGNDHLLSIDSTGYTEEYKRFYFRDIQALTICGNQRRVVWNWILLAVLVIPLAWLATMLFDREINSNAIWILWSIITSILLIPLIVNNLFGATCNCYLRTAVQVEERLGISQSIAPASAATPAAAVKVIAAPLRSQIRPAPRLASRVATPLTKK